MLNFFIDTCVWLDLAKAPNQAPVLGVLEELVQANIARLLLSEIVYTEFERNRERIVQQSNQGMSAHLKQVKALLNRFGDPQKKKAVLEQLNNVDHKIMGLSESAAGMLNRIDQLFKTADLIEPTDVVTLAAAKRALVKKAPFHRGKNSMADALLIETYADCLRNSIPGHRFIFVTHNKTDFGATDGDERQPHPDIAAYFSKIKSRYATNLAEAMRYHVPELVTEAMVQAEWADEPRSLSAMLQAIDELTDKVWYNRHQNRVYRIAKGEDTIIEKEALTPATSQHTIVREIWESAKKSAQRLEKKYGRDALGPWDDFEWGMLNGRLSALRWTLGEDWDSLYT